MEFRDCRIEMLTLSYRELPTVSKIKQLNRGETLAINMVMRMDVSIKLKCKMQGKWKNRGWERNMLFWSSSLGKLEWYLLEKQSFHLPQTHKRMWQDEKCMYIRFYKLTCHHILEAGTAKFKAMPILGANSTIQLSWILPCLSTPPVTVSLASHYSSLT